MAILVQHGYTDGLPMWLSGKESATVHGTQEMWVGSLDWEDPLEEEMTTTPVFLPGKSQGQRSLAGYSHGVAKELDSTD